MRSDEEMMGVILDTAREDDRVLAVYLKGSRTNPNAPADRYRDFDIMYVVKETESFIRDTSWMERFGKVILKQEQDDAFGYGDRFGIRQRYDESYSWLLLFEDGSRIDIGVELCSVMEEGRNRNRLYMPLLDKTGCLPELPQPSDEEFHIKKPDEKQFRGCCNEFYWCLCEVTKGIARDELPYAMNIYNTLVREMLEQMLDWYIGTDTDFSVSAGKYNKYLKRYLSADYYDEYVRTYTDGDYRHFRTAIDKACELFRETAMETSSRLGYEYPEEDEKAFRSYSGIIFRMAENSRED